MVLPKVFLEGVVVEVVVGVAGIPAVAEETTLVLLTAVFVELIVIVEARAAEAAQRMALEAGLVDGAWSVVAVSHVPLELLVCKQLVLVGEDLLVAGAQVAHFPVMNGADMAVEVGPAEAGEDAVVYGTVIAKKDDGITHDLFVCVLDADVVVETGDVFAGVVFEPF